MLHDDAWAAPTLDAELQRASLSRADASLATQIVYGALRVAPDLEAAIARYARRSVKVDDWVRAALLGGSFQLLHLGRVPPHAVVDDTVQLVREKRGRRVGGFANAILRRLVLERPEHPVPPISVSVPEWLRDALESSIGKDQTERLLSVGDAPPSIDLRIRADVDRDAVADAISRAKPGCTVARTALSPRGLRVSGAGDPRELPGYAQGHFAVQEEGAQLIGMLVGTAPGDRVLDVCAGRGGKTAQLVEAAGIDGTVIATDVHEHRLERIPSELRRLRLDASPLRTECVDWTVGPGPVREDLDRVLVDAPCTGLGTLRRRPEILLRAAPGDAARMGEVQRRILTHAASRVRCGGTLLYAVCSPLAEEGEGVVRDLDLPGFELEVERASGLESLRFGRDGRLVLGPSVQGAGPWADAYQIYMWVHVG